MAEINTRRILAENLRRLMDTTPGLDTPRKLSMRCFWPDNYKPGKKVSEREIRYALNHFHPTDHHYPGLAFVIAIANVFKKQPWELLVDDDTARRWIVARIISGKPATPEEVGPRRPSMPAGASAAGRNTGRRTTSDGPGSRASGACPGRVRGPDQDRHDAGWEAGAVYLLLGHRPELGVLLREGRGGMRPAGVFRDREERRPRLGRCRIGGRLRGR